jgi:V8-like Glu-specific endopeptidase
VGEAAAFVRTHPDGIDMQVMLGILGALRRKRWFELLGELGESLLQAGRTEPVLTRLYAQSLIDRDLPSAAVAVLDPLRETLSNEHPEYPEVEGLLGRAYKQMLVAGPDAPRGRRMDLLNSAVSHYLGVYRRSGQHRWHAVNAAALLALGRREDLGTEGVPEPEEIATEVLGSIGVAEAAHGLTAWDLACGLEACLGLGRSEDAVTWTHRYTSHPDADVFELSATLRQLTEVWQLRGSDPPGREILPLLRAAVLARSEGGRVEVDVGEVAAEPSGLEKVLGADGMVTYTWYRTGLDRSRAVAQIGDEMGEPAGTGFLVKAEDLGVRGTTASTVVLTNAHVVGEAPGALDPDDTVVTFHVLADSGTNGTFRVKRMLWTSPSNDLDVAVLELDRPVPDADGCPITDKVPRADGAQRVYVVGHPRGRSLSYSLDDNVLLDTDDRLLHYRAPTEPGNSGSPVFNRAWKIIGIHHAGRSDMPKLHGSGTYPANEGIWIEAIRRRLAEQPTGL